MSLIKNLTGILLLSMILFTACSTTNEITGNPITEQETYLKIGAILPMSGPAAIWGESLRNGMELAKKDLAAQGIHVDIIYEDSQADAKTGIAAYRKLKDIDNVDAVVTAFSRVSIPLIPLAHSDQTPIITTVVAAKGVAQQSPYAFRFYSDEKGYVEPHLKIFEQQEFKTAALLTIDDEYGASVNAYAKEALHEKGIRIVADEKFDPRTTDFRTQLLKIKQKQPDALIFIGAIPLEIVNVIKQFNTLELEAKFFETAPFLSVESTRSEVELESEGMYTAAFPFTLNEYGDEFKQKHRETYKREPFFAAPFGYDIIIMLGKVTDGKSLEGKEIAKRILDFGELDTLNGKIKIQINGEINPILKSVKIENGELVI